MTSSPDLDAIRQLISDFEAMKKNHQGGEVWSGRDLMELFQYSSWQGFRSAVNRAKEHVQASGANANDHFIQTIEMVTIGSGAERERENIFMTRHGAYMLMQELRVRDSLKAAFAKTYFSGQTRIAEVIQQQLAELDERISARKDLRKSEKDLSQTLWDRGVNTPKGIATVRSEGDKALFGKSTRLMKRQVGVDNAPLANKLHTIAIKAKELTAAMTVHNAETKDLKGQLSLENEHVDNNLTIRDALGKRGIKPEDLPPGEDTRKLERQKGRGEKGAIRTTKKKEISMKLEKNEHGKIIEEEKNSTSVQPSLFND